MTDVTLGPELQQRGADDFTADRIQEHGSGIFLEKCNEQDGVARHHAGLGQRRDDVHHRAPPVGSLHPCRAVEFGTELHQHRTDGPVAERNIGHREGQDQDPDRAAQFCKERDQGHRVEKSQSGDQARHGAWHQCQIQQWSAPAEIGAVNDDGNGQHEDGGNRTADAGDQEGIDDRAHIGREFKQRAEIIQGQHFGNRRQRMQQGHTGPQHQQSQRHDNGGHQVQADAGADPPAHCRTELEQPRAARLATDGFIFAGAADQLRLQHQQQEDHADEQQRRRGDQAVIGQAAGHAAAVQQGRNRPHASRLAEHQRDRQHFQRAGEGQQGAEQDRRLHQWQRDVQQRAHAPGAGNARRIFERGVGQARRRQRVDEHDRRHRDAGDDRHAAQRKNVPWAVAQQFLQPLRHVSGRPVYRGPGKRQHQRRHIQRPEKNLPDHASARQVGAPDQDRRRHTERQRQHSRAACQHQRIAHRDPEILRADQARIIAQSEMAIRIVQRRIEERLHDDGDDRRQHQEHSQRRQAVLNQQFAQAAPGDLQLVARVRTRGDAGQHPLTFHAAYIFLNLARKASRSPSSLSS